MTLLKRIFGFMRRLFHGEDVVLVLQTKEQWDRQFVDGKWDRLQTGQPNTIELARLTSNYARTKNGNVRVLDIGCGNGGLARLLIEEKNITYTGIDISDTALKAARTIVPHGNFIATDAEQPPSDIGTFDVLVFNEVFFYVNPYRALPRYHLHATLDARVFISVVRSWRTPFVFHRIRRHLYIDTRFHISDGSHQWDIAAGHLI